MSIVFDHVTYWYGDPASHHALHDVSCALDLHQTICVVGKTGSGKSTLVDHISAAITPCQGRVLINDSDTRNKRLQPVIRKIVGHVGQFPEHQLFADTVYEDIAFGPRNLGLCEDEVNRVVHETCKLLEIDLALLGERNPLDLSGGQQRRVALAGIVAMKPEILILDEPMAGLDPQGRRLIKRWIAELKLSGMTIIIVTHSMEDAAEFGDTLVIMHNGRIAAHGNTAELMSNQALLAQFELAPPQSVVFAEHLLKSAQVSQVDPVILEILQDQLTPLPTTLDALEEAIVRAYDARKEQAHNAVHTSDPAASEVHHGL